MKGYMGKILRIDLTGKEVREENLDEDMARLYIGGSGLGAKILFDETEADLDPLDPASPLIFAVGPVTGVKTFNSDRFEAIAKSPLTGIYGEANVGGYWGSTFKKCGYDAVVITGSASEPSYIAIADDSVEIKNAGHLWGKDTFESTELLKQVEGTKAKAAVIGPAGENQVLIANIITDGRHGRSLGRCGFGALMGSKNLKAVVANGSKTIDIANPDKLKEITKKLGPTMKENPRPMREAGTANGLDFCEDVGNFPVRNWSGGAWKEGAKKITGYTMTEKRLTKTYHCGQCVISCGRVIEVKGGPYDGLDSAGPEYETLSLLGANCLSDDLDGIIKSNELCNRYGLDTISTGNAIGFAMEAYENGLIDESYLDEVRPEWGSVEAIHKLIEQISDKSGLGSILGGGVKRAAEELGGNAEEFAIHVKGLEPAAHDPRAKFTVALGYATSNRGACHLQAFTHDFEEGGEIEDLGTPRLTDRFTPEGKAENVIVMQHLMSMFDSLVACKFGLFGGLTINPLVDVINSVTGWDWTRDDFFKAGERIFNLKRLYNTRLGISRKDDTLPPRMLTQRKGGGTSELPPLNIMLEEYYKLRGWNEFGIPRDEKIQELGIV